MATNNYVNGADMMLFVKKGANYTTLGCATSHTLTFSTNMLDTTAPTHKDLAFDSNGGTKNWSSSVPQTNSWTVTSDNLVADSYNGITYDDLAYLWINSTEIEGKFYTGMSPHDEVPSGGYTTDNSYAYIKSYKYYEGKCYINNLTLNAPAEGKATFTVELTGNGAIQQKTETPAGQ